MYQDILWEQNHIEKDILKICYQFEIDMAYNIDSDRHSTHQIDTRFHAMNFILQQFQNVFPSVLSEKRSGTGDVDSTDPAT